VHGRIYCAAAAAKGKRSIAILNQLDGFISLAGKERGRIFTFNIYGFASIDPPANTKSQDLTLLLSPGTRDCKRQ